MGFRTTAIVMEPVQHQRSSEECNIIIVLVASTYEICPHRVTRRPTVDSAVNAEITDEIFAETGPYMPHEMVIAASTSVAAGADEDSLWTIPRQETVLLHYHDELVLNK